MLHHKNKFLSHAVILKWHEWKVLSIVDANALFSMKWQKVTVCAMIEGVGILYGSCQASLIEDVRMSHATPKFVPETGAQEEGNGHFCDFLLCRTCRDQ